MVRGAKEQPLAAGQEPATGGFATLRHFGELRTVGTHHVLLITGTAVARALERDVLAVGAEIRFRVFPTIGELHQTAEMGLAGVRGNGSAQRRCTGGG